MKDRRALEVHVREPAIVGDRSGFARTIEVDGGISAATAAGAWKAGAELLVAGSAILGTVPTRGPLESRR